MVLNEIPTILQINGCTELSPRFQFYGIQRFDCDVEVIAKRDFTYIEMKYVD